MTGHIYIVDDDIGFRESLVALASSVGFTTVAYPDARAILEANELKRPGCVILDYRLPILTGMQTLTQLRSASSIPIVLVSAFASVRLATAAMIAGASMVFEKPLNHNEFIETIEQLCLQDLNTTHQQNKCNSIQERLMTLTSFEAAILDHLLAHRGNKEIAYFMDKCIKIVERTRTQILAKLGVSTLSAALLLVGVCPLQKLSPANCTGHYSRNRCCSCRVPAG